MKAKFKVSQLAAKAIEVELVHPTAGETGIKVKLLGPHSQQVRDAYAKYHAIETPSDGDEYELLAGCFAGWDEEAFEMEFSKENVIKFFSNPENSWAAQSVAPTLKDPNAFFRPKG